MTEPLTFAALGGVALSEGIRFLYGQAEELLNRRREGRTAEAEAEAEAEAATPELPAPDSDLVRRFEPDLRALLDELRPHVAAPGQEGASDPPGGDQLRRNAEAVRQILSAIHGIHIAPGQASPATVQVHIDVEKVAGYVAAVRARSARGTSMDVRVQSGEVAAGGEVVGLDLDSLG